MWLRITSTQDPTRIRTNDAEGPAIFSSSLSSKPVVENARSPVPLLLWHQRLNFSADSLTCRSSPVSFSTSGPILAAAADADDGDDAAVMAAAAVAVIPPALAPASGAGVATAGTVGIRGVAG